MNDFAFAFVVIFIISLMIVIGTLLYKLSNSVSTWYDKRKLKRLRRMPELMIRHRYF